MVCGVVVAAVSLSACGSSTPAARKASLDSYVASLGASPNLQVSFTANFIEGHSKVESILKKLAFVVKFSNPSGAAISQSSTTANVDMAVTVAGATFLDIRGINHNLYIKANVDALKQFSGIHISTAQLDAVQLAFGGRWFELPQSVLKSLVPAKASSGANSARDRILASKVLDALTTLIVSTPAKNLGGGSYLVQGTVHSVAVAVAAALSSAGQSVPAPRKDSKGTYKLTISTSGSQATAASLSITGPNGGGVSGITTVGITATFMHNNDAVTAPTGATVLSTALLRSLFGRAIPSTHGR